MAAVRNVGRASGALRDQSAFRTWGTAECPVRWACGFMLKPNHGAYENRKSGTFVLVYVLRGHGTFITDGVSLPIEAGCACMHYPNTCCSLIPAYDGQWAEVYLEIDGPLFARFAELGMMESSRPVLRPGVAPAVVERFELLLRGLRELPESELIQTVARTIDILAEIQRRDRYERAADSDDRVLEEACMLLADDRAGRRPLPAIARELRIGYERFRKLFAERMGVSPGEYRIRRRIDRARELIISQRLDNKQVARVLGYPDAFSFSKQFRLILGESPSAFRRRMLG